MKVVGSGYFSLWNGFASPDSGNLPAYARGSPEKARVSGSYPAMSGSKAEGDTFVGGVTGVFALGCAGGGVGRVATSAGGTGARVGAGAVVGGAADTLWDRSRRAAWIGESLESRAEEVGRVATMLWIVPVWVVMVSS